MTKTTKKQKALTMGLVFVMILSLLIPAGTKTAKAFSGKKGSTYEVVEGGVIWYGTGNGASSNTRKTDLGDGLGSRYSYCVQPDKPAGPTGTVTIDKVVTDDADTGKWNALRNIIYYSPSYPGYEDNVKNIRNASFYTGDFELDWGIAHLALSYIYAGRPSDLPTFMGTHASDLGDVWTKAKAMGDAMWKDGTTKDDAVPDNFKVFISYMKGVQDMLVGYMEAPGKLTMEKESNRVSVTADNDCYSLAGAEYTVYDSDGKAKGTLEVKANGKSNTVELDAGKYTVKETKAPKGYAKDTKTYTVKIESEEITEMTAKEEPITDPVELLLTKDPKGYPHDHGEGDATLKGAVYCFRYYDGQYDTVAKAEASGKATATWYFVTDEHGKISGQNPVKSSKYTSSSLYKDKDGNVCYPLGTYVIIETDAPEGYLVNDAKIVVHVTEDGTDSPHVKTYNESAKGEDTIIRGGVKLSKIDNDLSEDIAQGDASLKDAEFTVYNKSKESVKVGGMEYSQGSACLTIKTDDKGIAESGKVLPYGSYTIKETVPSKGYLLNKEWEKSFTIRSDGEVKDFTAEKVREEVERGGVQIVKRDKEIEKSEALGGGSLEGIVMTIKNVSDHDVVVRSDLMSEDKVDWKKLASKDDLFGQEKIKRVKPGEDAGKITVHWNEEKNAYTAETLADDLPYGTYTIRESKTTSSYQRTDKSEHRFEVRKDGTIYAYDNGMAEILTFDDYVYRSDVQGTKIGDGTSERLAFVPFKITSVTNGETHVVVTDKNGFFSTRDRRDAGSYDEDEDADTARKQNPFDDLLEAESITKDMIEKRAAEIQMGVWFGTGEAGTKADMNSDFGALPYDTYNIEEMPCEQNEGYEMQKFQFTVDDKTQTGKVDLATITDDRPEVPEIGTKASVDGKNADVTPKKEVTLVDTIMYKGLKKGEKYTAKGKLIDKKTGKVMKDAKGKAITAETEFTARSTEGATKVTFKFDGSKMDGMDTVVFESVYDVKGRIVARHEDPKDEDQTVTWDNPTEEPSIGTTLTDKNGKKETITSEKTILVDTVEYKGLDTAKWYIVTGELIVKDTKDPLVENGKKVTAVSKPFRPAKSSGKTAVTFEVNTSKLQGKELVAFETAYRLDGYKKGEDVKKTKKEKIAEHKDINDKGQTVTVVGHSTPDTPYHAPRTGDHTRLAIPIAAMIAALVTLLMAIKRKRKMM